MAIAGVGPHLSRVAGEVCDGFHVHPFHTIRYLDEVVIANIRQGAEQAGRSADDVSLMSTVFVVTGRDESEMSASLRAVKSQIAFYASTPSYRVVLETEGWDFGPTLSMMSRRGEWDAMAEVIPDEVVAAVGVIAEPSQIGQAIRNRYDGRLARVGYYTLDGVALPDDQLAGIVAATRG